MPGKVYRTAIYCRLSREDGDKVESNSIASQRAICEDYIARHDDLEIVCEPFVDDGYSGVSFNRPNFKKLEDAIRKGAIDCIVVKDLSRFSRNYIDGGRYLEKIFPQLGIRFIAVNDAYDCSSFGAYGLLRTYSKLQKLFQIPQAEKAYSHHKGTAGYFPQYT